MPADLFGPGHERQCGSVRRPSRMVFRFVTARHSCRSAIRVVHNPQPIHDHKRQATLIGRRHCVTDLLRDKSRFVFDWIVEVDARTNVQRDIGAKLNLDGSRSINGDPPQSSVVRGDEVAGVWA